MSGHLHALGRALVSIVFIVFGTIQFINIQSYFTNPAILKFCDTIGNVVSPQVVAYIVATADLVGGVLILIGWQVRIAAWILFVFVALTLWFAHPFWTMEGPARVANQAHFMKNLTIMGALLLLAANGAGCCSVEQRGRTV
jgi:putative oxidoreductase